jgi:hypothetical protein
VFAVIGPNREVGEDEIMQATLALYRTLFADGDGVTAWRAMNAVGPAPRTFDVFTAKFSFRYVMHRYLKTMCTDQVLSEREDQAVRKAEENGFSGAQLEHFRAWFRLCARDHRSHFEKIKRHFFFCDVYPENENRFRVSFEDCEDFSSRDSGRDSGNDG